MVKERIVLFLLKNQKSQFECLIPFSHTAIEPVILQTNLTNPQEPDNLSKTDVPCPVRIKRVHHLSLQCFSTDKRITKKIYCQSTEHSTAIHTQRSLILGRLIQQNILSSSWQTQEFMFWYFHYQLPLAKEIINNTQHMIPQCRRKNQNNTYFCETVIIFMENELLVAICSHHCYSANSSLLSNRAENKDVLLLTFNPCFKTHMHKMLHLQVSLQFMNVYSLKQVRYSTIRQKILQL